MELSFRSAHFVREKNLLIVKSAKISKEKTTIKANVHRKMIRRKRIAQFIERSGFHHWKCSKRETKKSATFHYSFMKCPEAAT